MGGGVLHATHLSVPITAVENVSNFQLLYPGDMYQPTSLILRIQRHRDKRDDLLIKTGQMRAAAAAAVVLVFVFGCRSTVMEN